MRLTWVQPEDLLPHELVQSRAEGKDTAAIRDRWIAAGGHEEPAVGGASDRPAGSELRRLARRLLDELEEQPARSSANEPEEWPAILSLLPPAPKLSPPDAGSTAYATSVLGAWTGRAAGCLLGKPVEKIPRQGIEDILRATGRWPLADWFTAVGLPSDVAARWPWNRSSAPTSLAENINGMPEDDDLNYPILTLGMLEQHGCSFETDDVAQSWLEALPAGRVFTAERAAYRNLLDARPVPATATHRNPFREWIGALIRADIYGWICPGDVRAAAHLAWRDARLSHVRNGIYGAMWAAALAAAAMTCQSVTEVLDAAGSVLPPGSKIAEAVRVGRTAAEQDWSDQNAAVRAGLDRLHAEYGHLHWVHVLNNAALIAFALQAGRGDFGHSISIAVTAGWDTDSTAATVGGVVGALRGIDGIGQRWTAPIEDRIATSLPGGEQRISDLAARTVALARRPGGTRNGTSS